MVMNVTRPLCLAIAFVFAAVPQMSSAAEVAGVIQTTQSYPTHTGLLVKLDGAVSNPEGCPGNSWYILPDNSPRAALMQSMILTAYFGHVRINFSTSGCYENYPRISIVTLDRN